MELGYSSGFRDEIPRRFVGQLLLMDEVSKYMVGPLSPYVRDFMDLTFKLETFVRENDKSLR